MGKHVSRWTVGAVVGAGATAFLALSPGVAVAQATAGAAAASNVPRTPDGQPDIQGWWDSDAYTPDLETGLTDPVTAQLQGQPAPNPADAVSIVVDPPDGRIPYQPWAAAKRVAIPSHRRGPSSTGVTAWSVMSNGLSIWKCSFWTRTGPGPERAWSNTSR